MQRELLLICTLTGLVLAAVLHGPPLRPDEAADTPAPLLEATLRPVLHANPPAPSVDSLSEPEALRHMSRLFRLQSAVIAAQAQGRHEHATRLLDDALTELDRLIRHPGLAERPRFQALYQSLATEYEAMYGVPDTLTLPQGEIYAIRHDLFATLNDAPTGMLLEDVAAGAFPDMDTAVPMTVNEKVKTSMATLLNHPHRHLYPWLRRSATYFPMIEHIFAEENVPDELKYLALVESGLNPLAQSRARAAGLWQFIAATGRHYDLTINPWVDERLDPEKSTRAAARHLRDLYTMFGDWQLALAGYNCDPRLVRRAVRKARRTLNRTPTFWDIYDDLPLETRNYVPTFIAAALIVSNPAAFDLDRVDPGPRYTFDYVPVQGTLALETVAELAGVDPSSVRALNPELRRDRLPPSRDPYYIRLPYGTYQTFRQNYQALSDDAPSETMVHTVRPGETVGRIAERYGVDWRAILDANGKVSGNLEVGERLTIPPVSYSGNRALLAAADGEPIRVRYGSRFTRPITSPELALARPPSQAPDR